MSYSGLRPSPALVVAVVALIAALAGAAVAAPVSNKGVTKSKAKKIADKEINKKAPGLSVDHATSADNANTVGGKTADDLLTSSAFGQNPQQIASLGTSFVNLTTATVTTHGTGRVLATASAELTGTAQTDIGQCQIVIDGIASGQYEGNAPNVAAGQFNIPVNYALPDLPAGPHTATLQCKALAGAVGKDDAAINVYGLGS